MTVVAGSGPGDETMGVWLKVSSGLEEFEHGSNCKKFETFD